MTNEFQPVTIPGMPDIVGQRTINDIVEYQIHNNALSEGGYVAQGGKVKLPPLEVTEREQQMAAETFESRPTSLLMTRESQDTFLLKAMAEVFCRENQLIAALSALFTARQQLAKAQKRADTAEKWLAEIESLPKEWEGSGYNPQQMGRLVNKLTEAQAEIASLKAQVERLKAPVSDKESDTFRWYYHTNTTNSDNNRYKDALTDFIAARVAEVLPCKNP